MIVYVCMTPAPVRTLRDGAVFSLPLGDFRAFRARKIDKPVLARAHTCRTLSRGHRRTTADEETLPVIHLPVRTGSV